MTLAKILIKIFYFRNFTCDLKKKVSLSFEILFYLDRSYKSYIQNEKRTSQSISMNNEGSPECKACDKF